MKNIIVYHHPCQDGFACSWICSRALAGQENEYIGINYGFTDSELQNVLELSKHNNVYILDFSFKPEILKQLIKDSNKLVLLDHHATAEKDLKDFVGVQYNDHGSFEIVHIEFDMNRSGAKMTWDYFNKRNDAPWLVNYVQDRDLWSWQLPDSKEVSAALFSYPKDFQTWDFLFEKKPLVDLVNEGTAILRYQNQLIDMLMKNKFDAKLGSDLVVPCVNTSILQSEVAGKLAEEHDSGIGACYYTVDKLLTRWSLRSKKDGPDVSAIAKKLGGGGHHSAAGFEIRIPEEK